jgi:hypothetical protein
MFTVRWKRSALNELAALWTAADSAQRQAITAASHRVDQLLANDPQNQGESRPRGRRILFVPPLGIIFRVDASTQVVFVLHVWRFDLHGQ